MESNHKRFLKRIQKLPRNRGQVLYSEVYKVFEVIYQKLYQPIEYEERLMELLKSFAEKKLLRFPKGKKYWDATKSTPRPLWIELPSEEKRKKLTPWKNEIWVPQMSWVTKINRMPPQTHNDLQRINDFLKIPKGDLPFPEKERSIQLFGDEKRLRELHTKYGKYDDLFNLTNSYKTHKPLTFRRYSTNYANAIILENRDTFDSFCRVNSSLKTPNYRYIIYGDGMEILERYDDILQFEKVPPNIGYFGDLDPSGLYIAQHLQKQIRTDECQLVLQFSPFYKRLVEVYKKQKWEFKFKAQHNPFTLDFVPPSEKGYIESLFRNNNRIPQELLNIEEIKRIFEGE